MWHFSLALVLSQDMIIAAMKQDVGICSGFSTLSVQERQYDHLW